MTVTVQTRLSNTEKLAIINIFLAANGKPLLSDYRKARHENMLNEVLSLNAAKVEKLAGVDNEIADAGDEPDALLLDPKSGEMVRESDLDEPANPYNESEDGESQGPNEPVKVEDVAPTAEKLPSCKQMAHVQKSSITKPVDFIHGWLDENPDVKRKVAVATLVGLGVAYATARTQYQRWFSVRKGK